MSPKRVNTPKRIKRYKASTMGDYMNIVSEIRVHWNVDPTTRFTPWYRGQQDITWPLIPTIYRPLYLHLDEDDLRSDFQLKAHPFLSETVKSPDGEAEWYFVMQHYGMPTRLIDWTENSLVALYFAVRSAILPIYDETDDMPDAVVWVLDPWKLNKKVAKWGDYILFPDDDELLAYVPTPNTSYRLPNRPMAVQPVVNSRRLAAQKGVFTIHGRSKDAIESYPEIRPHLAKIVIPRAAVKEILLELRFGGISESVLFPGLDGLSRELIYDWTCEVPAL